MKKHEITLSNKIAHNIEYENIMKQHAHWNLTKHITGFDNDDIANSIVTKYLHNRTN